MKPRNIALTGVPRGGTTLACQLLGGCENTVSLFEPMDVAGVPANVERAIGAIDAFYADIRERLTREGIGISKHRGGVVPDNPFDQDREPGMLRLDRTERGPILVGRQREDFNLVIKHNAMFVALLPDLAARWPTLAVVRNPLAVLASWNSVDLPVTRGRLPAGERLDPRLHGLLEETPGRLERQLIILEWFFSRIRDYLAAESILRYEDIVASHGRSLWTAADLMAPPRLDLRVRNASPVYAESDITRLLDGLTRAKSHDRASWAAWYADDEIHALAGQLLSGAAP